MKKLVTALLYLWWPYYIGGNIFHHTRIARTLELIASFATNTRFFSLFQPTANKRYISQRLLSFESKHVLQGKDFVNKVESTIFAMFDTLRLRDLKQAAGQMLS
jgi:hypothetical protein